MKKSLKFRFFRHPVNGPFIPFFKLFNYFLKKFDGTFYTCLKKANRNAQALVSLIIENFKSFQDFGEYKGQKGKRNSICVIFSNNSL